MHRQRGPFPHQNGMPGHGGNFGGPCGPGGPHMMPGNMMGHHGGPMGCNHPHPHGGPCQVRETRSLDAAISPIRRPFP